MTAITIYCEQLGKYQPGALDGLTVLPGENKVYAKPEALQRAKYLIRHQLIGRPAGTKPAVRKREAV